MDLCESKSDIRNEITNHIGAEKIKANGAKGADVALKRRLGDAGKVILLFDSVERADIDNLNWLLRLVSEWAEWLKGLQFRAIFAGRYTHASDNASKWPMLLTYKRIELSPFTQGVVQKAIQDTMEQHPPTGRMIKKKDFSV